ncbi:deoxyribonuclease V [Montanilutibacter psychrotolerans]|uniref:Endonuclease V n=1 Tax=Montanilutibacter psychrotolerans TaxID=1327343 RepID=A0A3M8T1N3_9GAMM|nr:deoxyribonuclease V [Lysobacter psychrotolerans]RNF85020.1 deoxyribonuclease V [Lysobacter psychrotolerans]
MHPYLDLPWPADEAAAEDQQRRLAPLVEREDRFADIRYVAGVDVAYAAHSDRLVAAAVVLDATSLAVVEQSLVEDVVRFPYIPGLFSFRELPPIAAALQRLQTPPDLIVCDGQGLAHPRRFGLACHLGVMFDVPVIGCGKTRLVGRHAPVGPARGEHADLLDGDEIIGSALRTRTGINPLYVSVGHRIGLASARDWVLRLSPTYRLPETTRAADHLVQEALKVAD